MSTNFALQAKKNYTKKQMLIICQLKIRFQCQPINNFYWHFGVSVNAAAPKRKNLLLTSI